MFGEYVQAVCNGYADVARGWKAISEIAKNPSMTAAHWSGLRNVLSHQHWPLKRDMTEVLEVAKDILTGSNFDITWRRYIETVNLYRDFTADLRCITPEIVEHHHQNNQNTQSEELLQTIELANRIYLSDTRRHLVFRDLMGNLTKRDGLTGLFLKGYASDDFLGAIRRKSAQAYWTIQDLVNADNHNDLSEIVDHQVTRGFLALEAIWALESVHNALDQRFAAEEDKQRAWADYRAMRSLLQAHDVPLEGFRYPVYEFYRQNWDEKTSIPRLKSHLMRAHRLFSNSTSESYILFIR